MPTISVLYYSQARTYLVLILTFAMHYSMRPCFPNKSILFGQIISEAGSPLNTSQSFSSTQGRYTQGKFHFLRVCQRCIFY